MIYLDYNASTPVHPDVREAMLPFLGDRYANPSSGHAPGRLMRQAVDDARERVASMLGASPGEIVFTSGGTEANNHVLKGVAYARRDRGRHMITSVVEHPAVLRPCAYLEREGYDVTYVGVDRTGMVDPQEVIEAVRPDTILISIMHANNEVGTIQPIAEIAAAAREGGVWMHTDAAQSCGKIDTDIGALGVDFLSLAGHKLYAPQGIGALYMRDGVSIEPLHHGAGHEAGRRAGTEPVAGIVALGAAAALATGSPCHARMQVLRDRLHDGLREALGDGVVLNGHAGVRLPNTLNIALPGRIGAEVLAAAPEICASTGAACHGSRPEPSAVLSAMGVPHDVALGAVRLSVGRFTTEEEIDAAVGMIAAAVGGGAGG